MDSKETRLREELAEAERQVQDLLQRYQGTAVPALIARAEKAEADCALLDTLALIAEAKAEDAERTDRLHLQRAAEELIKVRARATAAESALAEAKRDAAQARASNLENSLALAEARGAWAALRANMLVSDGGPKAMRGVWFRSFRTNSDEVAQVQAMDAALTDRCPEPGCSHRKHGNEHPHGQSLDTALARAGEQEAGACAEGEKAVQGEPASSGQDGRMVCTACRAPLIYFGGRWRPPPLESLTAEQLAHHHKPITDAEILAALEQGARDREALERATTRRPEAYTATPPPGEQGKGAYPRGRWACRACGHDHLAGTGCMRARFAADGIGIEKCDCAAEPERGPECGQIGERWVCVKPLWHAGLHAYELRPAPAQPAEHPAKEK